jgi:hypothetical protein
MVGVVGIPDTGAQHPLARIPGVALAQHLDSVRAQIVARVSYPTGARAAALLLSARMAVERGAPHCRQR